MPRKPNYKFDRMERDRQKAAKKAERLKAKQERSEERKEGGSGPEESELPGSETPTSPAPEASE